MSVGTPLAIIPQKNQIKNYKVPSWVGPSIPPHESIPGTANYRRIWLEMFVNPAAPAPKISGVGTDEGPLPSAAKDRMISLRASECGYVMVGRALDSALKLTHITASREHATLIHHRHTGGVFVVDLQSNHGTFINGKRIPPNQATAVTEGVRLSFGASNRYFKLKQTVGEVEWDQPSALQSSASSIDSSAASSKDDKSSHSSVASAVEEAKHTASTAASVAARRPLTGQMILKTAAPIQLYSDEELAAPNKPSNSQSTLNTAMNDSNPPLTSSNPSNPSAASNSMEVAK